MSEEPTPLRHLCTVSKTSQLVAQCTQGPQHIPAYLPTQTNETHVPSNLCTPRYTMSGLPLLSESVWQVLPCDSSETARQQLIMRAEGIRLSLHLHYPALLFLLLLTSSGCCTDPGGMVQQYCQET